MAWLICKSSQRTGSFDEDYIQVGYAVGTSNPALMLTLFHRLSVRFEAGVSSRYPCTDLTASCRSQLHGEERGSRAPTMTSLARSPFSPPLTDFNPIHRNHVLDLGPRRATRIRQHAATGVQRRRCDPVHV